MHGTAALYYENGDIYTGSWQDGYMHGEGYFESKLANYVYTGQWAFGLKEGFGEKKFQSGVYNGLWKSGKKHGFGVLIQENGPTRKYIGQWKNDHVV